MVLAADTVPIYWGDPLVGREFNIGRFINCHEFDSFNAVIEKVKELDADKERYLNMLCQPWFFGEPPPAFEDNCAFRNFLFHIFDQGPKDSRRATKYGYSMHCFKRADKIYKFLDRNGTLRKRWRRGIASRL